MTPLFVFSLDFWISCSKHIFGVSWLLSRTQQESSSNLFWLVITWGIHTKKVYFCPYKNWEKFTKSSFAEMQFAFFTVWTNCEEKNTVIYGVTFAPYAGFSEFLSFKAFSFSKRQNSFPIGESAGTRLYFDLNCAAKEIFVINLPIRCNILKGVDKNEPKTAEGMYLPIPYGAHMQAMILHFSCLS